jgi:hypothetical protein
MGKGTIVSHLGSGKYSVVPNRDLRRITTYLAWIEKRLAELLLALIDYEVQEIAAKAAYSAEIVAMNAIVQQMRDHPDQYATLEPQLIEATKNSLTKQGVWQGWIYALRYTRLEQTALQKKKVSLESIGQNEDLPVEFWCADLTTDMSGVVATAEVPTFSGGVRGYGVNIRPGYQTREVYAAKRDGQVQPVESGTAASAFFNWALYPGWQKWKPSYRYGTITAIDGNKCTVVLDDVYAETSPKNPWAAINPTTEEIAAMKPEGAGKGYLKVAILPAAAATAVWSAIGPTSVGPLQNGDAVRVQAGTYELACWPTDWDSWGQPPNQTVTVKSFVFTRATFTIPAKTASILVNILPAEAVTAGAKWQINNDDNWRDSGAIAMLIFGTYTVSFKTVEGYSVPTPQTVALTGDATQILTGTYT